MRFACTLDSALQSWSAPSSKNPELMLSWQRERSEGAELIVRDNEGVYESATNITSRLPRFAYALAKRTASRLHKAGYPHAEALTQLINLYPQWRAGWFNGGEFEGVHERALMSLAEWAKERSSIEEPQPDADPHWADWALVSGLLHQNARVYGSKMARQYADSQASAISLYVERIIDPQEGSEVEGSCYLGLKEKREVERLFGQSVVSLLTGNAEALVRQKLIGD